MTRITRYILTELIGIFFVTLTLMTLTVILVVLAAEAIRQGLSPGLVLQLIPYELPIALQFAIPGTILFAACSVYGRMSAANEIVAIKSLGIRPRTIIVPAIVLSLFVSAATVVLNDLAASWGRRGAQRVILQSLEQIAYGMLRTHRSFSRSGLSISVTDVDERRLIRPTISFQKGPNGQTITITADEAELQSRPERNSLIMLLHNCVIEVGNSARMSIPGIHEQEIPITDAEHNNEIGAPPTECALRQIPAEIVTQQNAIQQLEQQAAANAAFQLATGDFAALSSVAWQPRRATLTASTNRLNRLRVEPWRRWANGFSCTAFVLVGIPLAIRLRTADVWTSFGLCFPPILILYYPLLAISLDRAKAGALPPYCIWVGNVILAAIGWWLFRKPKLPWKGSLNEL